MSWCSRRRWRAACRDRDRMRPVRNDALALLQAIDAGLGGWRLHGRTCCLAFSKEILGGRLGEIAVRPLTRYLRGELRAIDAEERRAAIIAKGRGWRDATTQIKQERRA